MPVSSVSNSAFSTQQQEVVDKDKVGFNGLTSDVFLKLLITQLQNQDPTQPVGNEELLNQLSTMRNLQANIELSDTLKSFSNNQQVSSGAAFLGKLITGDNANGDPVVGIADRVFLKDGDLMVGIGEEELKISKITGVSLLPGTSA